MENKELKELLKTYTKENISNARKQGKAIGALFWRRDLMFASPFEFDRAYIPVAFKYQLKLRQVHAGLLEVALEKASEEQKRLLLRQRPWLAA